MPRGISAKWESDGLDIVIEIALFCIAVSLRVESSGLVTIIGIALLCSHVIYPSIDKSIQIRGQNYYNIDIERLREAKLSEQLEKRMLKPQEVVETRITETLMKLEERLETGMKKTGRSRKTTYLPDKNY